MVARKIGSRYTISGVLGRGTCGTVYEGEGPDGPVAVKLLREDLAADQTLIARFVQERTALTSLHHPHVVGVRDLVVDGTDLALVMDLIRGSDLRHLLEAEHCLRPQLAVQIVADVAEGLAAAHAQGIIHRDVKPENILLDKSSGALVARLADFGIARLVDGPRRTRATRIVGTPDYLAPEVIEGLQPGPAVDMYSLGTVLFELLTGWTPFGGGHPGAVLRRHVTDKIPPLPGVPGPLAALVASCLAKGPAARLTASEFGLRLRELSPLLADMQPLDVPDPREAGWDVRSSARASVHGGRMPTVDPIPMRHSGIMPLVQSNEFADDTRDTHLNLMRPIREGEDGGVRRRSGTGTYEVSALRAERPGDRSADRSGDRSGDRFREDPGSKRPRWMVATAAALIVGGGAAAIAMGMSDDSHGKTGGPTQQQPAANTGTDTTAHTASVRLGAAGIAFAPARELPPAPVAIQGAPTGVVLKDSGNSALYVFVTGTDGSIWYLAGSAKSWTPLHGLRAAWEPAVIATGSGRLELFAVRAGDGQVLQRSFSGGAWTGKWTQVGAVHLHGGLAAAPTAEGGAVLLGVGPGKTLVTDTAQVGAVGLAWGHWSTVPDAGSVAGAWRWRRTPPPAGSRPTSRGPRTRRCWRCRSWATPGRAVGDRADRRPVGGDGRRRDAVRVRAHRRRHGARGERLRTGRRGRAPDGAAAGRGRGPGREDRRGHGRVGDEAAGVVLRLKGDLRPDRRLGAWLPTLPKSSRTSARRWRPSRPCSTWTDCARRSPSWRSRHRHRTCGTTRPRLRRSRPSCPACRPSSTGSRP